jgi:hypothetical protein
MTRPNQFSIKCKKSALLLITLIFTASGFSQADARNRQDIRFYKANKILQTDRIWFTKKRASKPGCHNFIRKARVYKAVQFAYAACYLYAKKNCESDSIIEVAKEKDETTTTVLLEGYGWLPQSDNKRGVRVKSWSCTHDPIASKPTENKPE